VRGLRLFNILVMWIKYIFRWLIDIVLVLLNHVHRVIGFYSHCTLQALCLINVRNMCLFSSHERDRT